MRHYQQKAAPMSKPNDKAMPSKADEWVVMGIAALVDTGNIEGAARNLVANRRVYTAEALAPYKQALDEAKMALQFYATVGIGGPWEQKHGFEGADRAIHAAGDHVLGAVKGPFGI